MANDKIQMNEQELDMVSGGETWICEYSGIGTDSETVVMKSVGTFRLGETDVHTRVLFSGKGCSLEAKKFIKQHKGDSFVDSAGKAFSFY